jgi:transcriptional regulator with XRE-family HTH domain
MRKSTHTPEYDALRRRLTEIRTSAGKSQRQLAIVLKVPHSWVAKVESGERRIDLVEFAWFCAACETSPATEAGELIDKWSRASGDAKARAKRGRP